MIAAAILAVAGFGVSAANATFTLSLTLGDGTSTSTTVSTGSVVTLDVFGTVTGTSAVGLQDAFFGVTNGGTNGDLSTVTLASPFNGIANDVSPGVTTSSSGTLYGAAGSMSVGGTDSSVADGWVFARSTTMTPATSGTAQLLGTLTYTVSASAAAGSSASLTINPRSAVNSLVIPAVWQEAGAEVDGVPSIGSGVTITVASAVVTHINGNTSYNNYDGGGSNEVVDLNDLNGVLNNLGTTNAAGYAYPNTAANDSNPVGLNDLNAVLNNLGTHASDPVGVSLAVVPEPASLGLIGMGALAAVRRRRR
ncbi:MAG TPA: PEP-CTERM sorting domain-containing protein [Tepidisphaeraceae bacterium]|jgi:hypothetical protein|nr:PEP-CTERM sorting domain-containing protein [Tepidisphaeraceae bacterium]